MPTAFLHVGGMKTGTTSLQRFLADNDDALYEGGLLVPDEGREPKSGRHRPLLLALCGSTNLPRRLLAAPRELAETLRTHPQHDVLLTCESLEFHFDGAPSPVVRFFAERGYDVHLVLYVRPQEERINSNYAQHVRTLFGNHDWDDFLARFVMSNALMYSRWIDVAAQYGVTVTVKPFARATRQGGVVADFFAALGRTAPDSPEPRLNESVSALAVAVARGLMARLKKREHVLTQRQRGLLADRLFELAAPGGGDPFYGFTPEQLRHVRRHFRGDNEFFARTVWGRGWDEVFPAEGADRLPNAITPGAGGTDEFRAVLALMLPVMESAIADPALKQQDWAMSYDEVNIRGIGRVLTAEDSFPPTPQNVLRI